MTPFTAVVLGAALGGAPAGGPPQFGGEKTRWHGFDRYDFLMDEADLSIKPHKAPPGEGNAVRTQVKGHLRCVVAPKRPAHGNPWSWRGYYFDHEPQAEVELLKRGFHVGFVWCDAGRPWDAWYKFLTETHGLAKKPAFVGMSRGGRNAYAWATANPDKVSCVYAENPILRSRMSKAQPLDRLAPLAKAGVPVLHVCGSRDPWLDGQTRVLEKRYKELGGSVTVIVDEGKGHFPTAPRGVKPVVDFIVSRQPAADQPPLAAGPRPARDYRFDGTISPGGAGELPVPGDLGRGHPQRPRRPR